MIEQHSDGKLTLAQLQGDLEGAAEELQEHIDECGGAMTLGEFRTLHGIKFGSLSAKKKK